MAEIVLFRGILYTPQAGDPSRLLSSPYDVINEADRQSLERLDPHKFTPRKVLLLSLRFECEPL